MSELVNASATALAQAIRDRRVSSQEVLEAYFRRIEEVNPRVNALVQLSDDARGRAAAADASLAAGKIIGPLHGVPVTVKDSFETAGMVSAAGTRGRASLRTKSEATAVSRLREAGAVIVGKTNLPELGFGLESDNLVYGRTNNPYDPARTCGGSSGGEAAALAACETALGLGSDAVGSIRVPAHFCGIAGLKPTTGLVPVTGHFPPAFGAMERLLSVGPMARRVEDLALALPVIAGADGQDPNVVPMPLGDAGAVALEGLRVAFYTDDGLTRPSPETTGVVHATARALAESGMRVEEARPGCVDQTYEIMLGIFAPDGGEGVRQLLDRCGTTETHPLTQRFLELIRPHSVTLNEYGDLMRRWLMFRREMLAFVSKYDAILCPVSTEAAPPHGRTFDDFQGFSYVMTYSLTGWPAVVVRAGTSSEGLPLGVQVVARPWREDVALSVARRVEACSGGWQPPPL
ncbi:MAG TPA: amidase [Pyrinomonadaceae bacterium]|jgi:amidase